MLFVPLFLRPPRICLSNLELVDFGYRRLLQRSSKLDEGAAKARGGGAKGGGGGIFSRLPLVGAVVAALGVVTLLSNKPKFYEVGACKWRKQRIQKTEWNAENITLNYLCPNIRYFYNVIL